MRGHAGEVLLDPLDFAAQRRNSGLKLVHRQGAQILFHEQAQWILRAAGEEVVLVHSRSVDPDRPQVNKLAAPAVAWGR